MEDARKILEQRTHDLSEIIRQAKANLKGAPEGKLRVVRNKGNTQYYHRKDSRDYDGTYIRKKEVKLIQQLASKEYHQNLLHTACQEQKEIERFLKVYRPENLLKIHSKLPIEKRKLVEPLILSDDAYAAKWQAEQYIPKEVLIDDDNAIYTENGEVVRSKSEKILADKLNRMQIPYHYEKPHYLKGFGTIYPDFTVLNKHTRKTYYWEHFGMMNNPEYCEKAIKKIETMAKSNIVPGRNLILTFETSTHPLNSKNIELLIREYLL